MQAAAAHTDYKALYEQQVTENKELQYIVASLKQQLEQLKKMIFGSKSERFVPADINKTNLQLSLSLEAETIAQCKITDATKLSISAQKQP